MENQVALTILDQLGGNRFIAMTGAKNLTYGPAELNMRVGRNAKGVTHVRVALKGDDTYTVLFIEARGHNINLLGKFEGIYADQLVELFEKETGLLTTL